MNIGAADDPMALYEKFGCNYPPPLYKRVVQFDLDRWPGKDYVQGDAHRLPFKDRSFEMVVIGDVHEHLLYPQSATVEAARVTSRYLIMTIFEEWRLPGPGQYVQAGQEGCEASTRVGGFDSYIDYCRTAFPSLKVYSDEKLPHHSHINQFVDSDIDVLVKSVLDTGVWDVWCYMKAEEAEHDGHTWSNWLIALERLM